MPNITILPPLPPSLQLKEELLSKLKPHLVGEELQRSHLTIQFVMPGSAPKQPAENLLPILTSACPLTFSTVKYFEVSSLYFVRFFLC